MLIKNLGQTRAMLLENFKYLSDDQINKKLSPEKWSIAQVLYHLYTVEKETSLLIFNSLTMKSEKVEERDLSFLGDRSRKVKASVEPPLSFFTKKELITYLEEARYLYSQAIFNETHEKTLAEKSMEHPLFGFISLKNVVDFIWMHELRHCEQITEIKHELEANNTEEWSCDC
ncbi:MAG: DinB family protein [Bacillus sp. (in: Bacteria)]|nr:DinB family protein [Bacillus sp. (in: firmicutes)]